MKCALVISFSLTILASGFCAEPPEILAGFHGVKWGSSMNETKKLLPLAKEDSVQQMISWAGGPVLLIRTLVAQTPAGQVDYTLIDDKLYRVTVRLSAEKTADLHLGDVQELIDRKYHQNETADLLQKAHIEIHVGMKEKGVIPTGKFSSDASGQIVVMYENLAVYTEIVKRFTKEAEEARRKKLGEKIIELQLEKLL